MEIRHIEPEDGPALSHIISRSFRRGEAVDMTPERLARGTRIGVFEGGRLQAALMIMDFEMFFGANRRPCGGIAGVACDPAARGRGHARDLLSRSLEMMREARQYVSVLWPFYHDFYRRFGWEWVGGLHQYKAPLSVLPSDPESRYIEAVHDRAPETLNPVYEACAARYNGALARTEARWQDHLRAEGRQPAAYIYRRDNQAEGYAILQYGTDDKELRAMQFVALTTRAYRGLIGLAHNHAMNAETFHWWGVPDDRIWSFLPHWDVEAKLTPGPMGRIVDVQQALEALRPSDSVAGQAVIAVDDARAPWNSGTWRIVSEGGRVQVQRDGAEPGLSMDILALTQAYWGTPSLAALRQWERITVQRESDYQFLTALLPPTPVWLADDF